MKNVFLLAFLVLLVLFAVADTTHAALLPLVQCNALDFSKECTSCDIFALVHRLLNLLWFVFAVPVATIMFVWGGGLMIFSGLAANPNLATKGRKILTNTLIGLVIIFFAWLGVDTIIKILANREVGGVGAIPVEPQKYGPWNELKCEPAPQTQTPSPSPTVQSPSSSAPRPSPGDVSGTTCPNCVRIAVPTKPGACKDSAQGQICLVDNTLNERLVLLGRTIFADGKLAYWRVTEAWPPTVTHQNPCHLAGTCVDANLLGASKENPQEIAYFTQKAERAGLKPVYEVRTVERKNELVNAGVREDAIQVVSAITAEHFSIYLR